MYMNKAISVALIVLISAVILRFSPYEIRTTQMDSRAEGVAREMEQYLWLLDRESRNGVASARFILQSADYLDIKIEGDKFFVILRQGVTYGIGEGRIPPDKKLIAPNEAYGRRITLELSGDSIKILVSG